ncbi:MAG: CDGSH iron-sulfur domain-containing protein [Alphaproteobacteria bacterium]|nr:CDGSH iron-sulfur domain-containing protein [Alphaproteobacteria bacterium]
MTDLKISQEKPVEFTVEKGERYSFCTCGYSKKMPLCDGAHREKAPGMRSYKYEAAESGSVWVCTCLSEDDPQLIKPVPKS